MYLDETAQELLKPESGNVQLADKVKRLEAEIPNTTRGAYGEKAILRCLCQRASPICVMPFDIFNVLLQKNTGYDIIKKIQTFQGELNAINDSNMR